MNGVNAKLARMLGFPENTTRADIRIRPMCSPEVELTYFIVDENSIPKEIEGKFELIEVDSSED